MALEDVGVKWLILDLMKSETDRDKQRLVGASQIGNPCDYCLGLAVLARGGDSPSHFWMGAKIGTATHSLLEEEAAKHIDRPRDYRFAPLEGAMIEQKIVLGHIANYGTIKSKPDLVLPLHNHLIDYKSSTKLKVKKYKLDGVPKQYIYQQQLYAWGLNNAGIKIDRISLVFINRDGVGDNDVWVYSFDYSEEDALRAWHRLESMVDFLHDNEEGVESLPSDPNCWACENIHYRI